MLKVRKEQKEIIECAGGTCMNCDPDIKALSESIEILSDYERVLKENNKLNIKLDDKEAEIQILKDDIKADDIEYKHVIEILKKENEELNWVLGHVRYLISRKRK